MKINNFITRTLTSIVFVAVLLSAIIYNPLTMGVLFTVITAMAVWEFGTIVNKSGRAQTNRFITTIAGAYLFVAIFSISWGNPLGYAVLIPYLITLIYLLISELYLKQPDPMANWSYNLMSQLYVALPMACINIISFFGDEHAYNCIFTLSVFFFLWAGDAGAYCVGSLIGKTPLFKRISPNKSWEGSIGGGVIAIVLAAVLSQFFSVLSIAEWIGLAITVVVFGTWGDLVESLMKRTLGIKDSGNILPGHGGMLDRFDSSLLAFPAATVYLYTVLQIM